MIIGTDDVIGQIAGITPGSRADLARRQKPELVSGAQDYYAATIAPDDPGALSLAERSLVAFRVALLTPQPEVAAFYRARLAELGVDETLVDAVTRFPEGDGVDARLAAILRHADRNTTAPREAGPEHLDQLSAVGLTPFEIVALSQVIAFVSYQARLVAVLKAMEAAS